MNDLDFSVHPANLEEQDNVTKLKELAEKVTGLNSEIDEVESRLKVLKKLRQSITHHQMPNLMNEMGMEMLSVDGTKFNLDLYVSGVWPKDEENKEIAINHLRELGALDLIKTELIAKFDRAEYDLAMYCLGQIKEFCQQTEIKVGVHPMTLRSFVKKRIKNGEEIDYESLGTNISPYVKVKK